MPHVEQLHLRGHPPIRRKPAAEAVSGRPYPDAHHERDRPPGEATATPTARPGFARGLRRAGTGGALSGIVARSRPIRVAPCLEARGLLGVSGPRWLSWAVPHGQGEQPLGEVRAGAGRGQLPQFSLHQAQPGGLRATVLARREMRVRPVKLGTVQLAVHECGQLLVQMTHGSPAFPDPVASGR
jgi:hypothetical protein